jgi:outer membrane lipoprotein LolB
VKCAQRAALTALLLSCLWLSGCALPERSLNPDSVSAQVWRGRLALRFDDPSLKAFSAGFELTGNERTGELLLFSPLGTTVASLRWSPLGAFLLSEGSTRQFDSLDALALEATGAALPMASLFQWLQGQASEADGWQSDLSQLSQGKLQARRSRPLPAAELRLVLEN